MTTHIPSGTKVHNPQMGNGEILYYNGKEGYLIKWWNNIVKTSNVFTVLWSCKEEEVRFKLQQTVNK